MLKILIDNAKKYNINVCRWGGEEFLLLMKNSSKEKAVEICKNILQNIRNNEAIYNNEIIKVTITFGCDVFNSENDNIKKVKKNADLNLYKGKKSTKNCITI